MSKIEIELVATKRQFQEFIRLPWRIYRDLPNWVPPLHAEMKEMLDRSKFPFFLHSEADFFLARKDGQVVGRIAAILNKNHIKVSGESTGFFGFYETIPDREVSDALFNTAARWLRGKNMQIMRGPANYSTNETVGFLTDSFDSPPVIMMTYNPRYYCDFTEAYGFTKAMDLYAYYMHKSTPVPDKLLRVAEKIRHQENIRIRTINMKKYWQEVDLIKHIYNKAWSYNWGFVPMTDAEFEHLAKGLKMLVNPDLVYIAFVNGEPAGFSLMLPDINQILIKLNGRLYPFGLPRLLLGMKKINMTRVITMGVIKEYQKRGIDAVFYLDAYQRGIAAGYDCGEFSWILESNVMMNRSAQMLGGKIYKTYRMYDYKL